MKKGAAYEKFVLETYLQKIWPGAYRPGQQGTIDVGDYKGIADWMIDAKKRDAWALPAWIRVMIAKAKGTHPWAIVYATDKRSGIPDMVTMPMEQWTHQMERLVRCKCE